MHARPGQGNADRDSPRDCVIVCMCTCADRSRSVGQAISLFQGGVALSLNLLAGIVLGGGSLLVSQGLMSGGQVASFLVHVR